MNLKGWVKASGLMLTCGGIGGNGAARSRAAVAASSSAFEPELAAISFERSCPSTPIVKRMTTVPAMRERGFTFARCT